MNEEIGKPVEMGLHPSRPKTLCLEAQRCGSPSHRLGAPPTPDCPDSPRGKTRSINMRLLLGPGGALGTVQVLNIIALLSFKWSLPQTGHPVLATSTGQNPH